MHVIVYCLTAILTYFAGLALGFNPVYALFIFHLASLLAWLLSYKRELNSDKVEPTKNQYIITAEGGIAYDNNQEYVHNIQVIEPFPITASSPMEAWLAFKADRVGEELLDSEAYNSYTVMQVTNYTDLLTINTSPDEKETEEVE